MINTSDVFAFLLDTEPLRLWLTLPDGTRLGDRLPHVLGTENQKVIKFGTVALLLKLPPRPVIKSAEWSGGSNAGDDITLGSTVAQQLKVELDREMLGGLELADQTLTATLTIDGAEDELPVAVVKVTNVDSDDDTVTVTAGDAMAWAFNEEYALDDEALGFDWTAGVDGETLLRTICDTCGVPLGTTGLPKVTLSLVDASGYTYREVIAFLACLWGRFARIDAQGRLVLQWYTLTDRPVGPGRYYQGELTKADYTYTVGYLKCYVEPLEETLSVGDTTKAQGIYIKCPWMTQERLEAIWEEIGWFTYCPVSNLRFLGDPRLEPGDVLQVTDRDGTAYTVPCMTLRHEYDGGLITEVTAAGKSESASEQDYQGPVTRAIERANQQLKVTLIKYQDRIEAIVEDMDGNLSKMTQELDAITMLVEALNGDYSKIEQALSSITLSVVNGSKSSVITLTGDLIGMQSQTIQFTGEVVFKSDLSDGTTVISGDNILTGHLSADRIEGGTLTLGGRNNQNGTLIIKNSSGAQVGYIDNTGVHFTTGSIDGPTVKSGDDSNYILLDGGKLHFYAYGTLQVTYGPSGGFAAQETIYGSKLVTINSGECLFSGGDTFNYSKFQFEDGVKVSGGGKIMTLAANSESEKEANVLCIVSKSSSKNVSGIVLSGATSVSSTSPRIYVVSTSANRINLAPGPSYGSGMVFSTGDLGCAGTKSRLVNTTDYDRRLLYCYEMPSPMFGDIGEGETDEAGTCCVYLDDVFAETVVTGIEYQVFLQKEGPGDLWVAEKTQQYFVVRGTENLKFAWEIKAKQRDYEYERLEHPDRSEPVQTQEIDYEQQYLEEIETLINEKTC